MVNRWAEQMECRWVGPMVESSVARSGHLWDAMRATMTVVMWGHLTAAKSGHLMVELSECLWDVARDCLTAAKTVMRTADSTGCNWADALVWQTVDPMESPKAVPTESQTAVRLDPRTADWWGSHWVVSLALLTAVLRGAHSAERREPQMGLH